MSDPSPIPDVVVAGAGPVGLFLACELRLAGVSVLVLERERDPGSPLKRLPFGMRGLSIPTIEAFDRRGLLDEIVQPYPAGDRPADSREAGAAHWKDQPRRPGGHFAGIQFFHDRIDTSAWAYHLPGTADGSVAAEMERIEAVLGARASALGVEVRRGMAVGTVTQSDDGVAVQVGADIVRGRWLVGCDGGRSTVRKAAGFAFAGTDPEFTGYSVEVELADLEALRRGRHYTPAGMYTYAPPGAIAAVEFDGGAFHRAGAVTRGHVEAMLRRVTGADVTVTALRLATTWTDRAYQATTYRRGRVLLAGDAAHIHSPLGGQGLNLGLGDAMNLGWKLAATIRGDAPAGLLDTYETERHPIGARVLDWSRAQVALMRPSPSSRALGAIMRDLIETHDGATYFAERVWNVSLRHDLGSDHPLVGRSVPDFSLADGTRVAAHLRDGKGLLLDFDARPLLEALAARWSDRIAYVAVDAEKRLGPNAVLVRPDGVVAWAGDENNDSHEAAGAMTRWFGDFGRSIGTGIHSPQP